MITYKFKLSPQELASRIGDMLARNGVPVSDKLENKIADVIERNLTKRAVDLGGMHAFKKDVCVFCGGRLEDVRDAPCPSR